MKGKTIMARVNKVIIVGNLGRDYSFEHPEKIAMMVTSKPPSISSDMPESGGVTDGPDVAKSDDDDGGDSDGEPARRPQNELKNRISKAGANSRRPLQSLTSDDAGNKMTNSNSGNHRTVTATAGALSVLPQNPDIALWRLPTVLAHIPISRSGWWQGVKTGRYPAPVKLSTRCVAWRSADIRALIASL
jgi:prophage regulatory protein